MFVDTGPMGPHWGNPPKRLCKSCRNEILDQHEVEEITFPAHLDTANMSGTYHAQCARPFASIAHAMNVLGRFSF